MNETAASHRQAYECFGFFGFTFGDLSHCPPSFYSQQSVLKIVSLQWFWVCYFLFYFEGVSCFTLPSFVLFLPVLIDDSTLISFTRVLLTCSTSCISVCVLLFLFASMLFLSLASFQQFPMSFFCFRQNRQLTCMPHHQPEATSWGRWSC